MAAVTGHCFSPYLRGRGGRGIATGLGTLLASDARVGLAAFAIWVVGLLASRIVSVASLVAAASLLPLAEIFHASPALVVLAGYLTCIAFVRHHANLARLFRGEERRLGSRPREQIRPEAEARAASPSQEAAGGQE
jgi:glycerol-3-phosphate acyltransferase PlsY